MDAGVREGRLSGSVLCRLKISRAVWDCLPFRASSPGITHAICCRGGDQYWSLSVARLSIAASTGQTPSDTTHTPRVVRASSKRSGPAQDPQDAKRGPPIELGYRYKTENGRFKERPSAAAGRKAQGRWARWAGWARWAR